MAACNTNECKYSLTVLAFYGFLKGERAATDIIVHSSWTDFLKLNASSSRTVPSTCASVRQIVRLPNKYKNMPDTPYKSKRSKGRRMVCVRIWMIAIIRETTAITLATYEKGNSAIALLTDLKQSVRLMIDPGKFFCKLD